MGNSFMDFEDACDWADSQLKSYGGDVDAGRWQGIPTEGRPDLVTREILDLKFRVGMNRQEWPDEVLWANRIAYETHANQLWADKHFKERVGGVPLNPDPSHEEWPWWQGQDESTKKDGKFTHTYSERFWPIEVRRDDNGVGIVVRRFSPYGLAGTYNDVLNLLAEEPYTRQAYLPIFFPEDTGAVHRGRIPCSLGYHFLLRGSRLHCWYEIRSCDAVRHFRDDVYLAARLVGHTIKELANREFDPQANNAQGIWCNVKPGSLYFTAHSFHAHMGDWHRL